MVVLHSARVQARLGGVLSFRDGSALAPTVYIERQTGNWWFRLDLSERKIAGNVEYVFFGSCSVCLAQAILYCRGSYRTSRDLCVEAHFPMAVMLVCIILG